MAIVLPDRKLIVVPMPSPENFTLLDNLVKTYPLTLKNGDKLLALPHTEDSLKLLNNMGINTNGCDLFDHYYTPPKNRFRSEESLYWYQYETAKFLTKNPFSFCTSTPRVGKTLAACTAADYTLGRYGGKCLVVAPLTVADGGEWEKTIYEWFPHRRGIMVHKDRFAQLDEPADFFFINPAGVKVCYSKLLEMAKRGDFTCVIVDELTEYANTKSDQWKALNAIVRHIPYRWGLTGTPGGAKKIYGQVKLINPNNVPRTFTQWRVQTMYQVTTFKWVEKPDATDTIKQAMSPCIRFDKDEVLNIPKPQVITEYVELSSQQAEITEALVKDMRIAVSGEEIDATTASTLAQKLLQVAGGVVRTENETIQLDATPKLEKLKELLFRTPAKKVIFGSYIGINNLLVDYVRSLGLSCEKIDGSVTGQTRSRILHDFLNNEDGPHVLVCHPRTTAYGVELASADMIICYGPPMSGAFMYQQLFERLSSTRQKAKETFVVHLASGRQDKVAFANLAQGVSLEQKIVSIFSQEFL